MNIRIPHVRSFSRRGFLKTSGAAAGALAGLSSAGRSASAEHWPPPAQGLIGKNELILFQGDSITDAGRNREQAGLPNDQAGLGSGYAWLAAVELLVDRPKDALKIFNRRVSGNKRFQLAERWQAHCPDLEPHELSILI